MRSLAKEGVGPAAASLSEGNFAADGRDTSATQPVSRLFSLTKAYFLVHWTHFPG